jgi:hypothetical protein
LRGEYIQVSDLPEPNIGVQGQSHEEHKGGIEKDQPRLANVTIVYRHSQLAAQYRQFETTILTNSDQQSGERTNYNRESALLHDLIHDRDREASKDCRHGSHTNIRDMVFRVAIANGLEFELAIETDKPSSKTEKELRKRRVHIKVVFPKNVVFCEFAEVDFVEPVPLHL